MKFSINFEFWYQMKAMTVRNMLIKRREMKKTFSVSIFYIMNKLKIKWLTHMDHHIVTSTVLTKRRDPQNEYFTWEIWNSLIILQIYYQMRTSVIMQYFEIYDFKIKLKVRKNYFVFEKSLNLYSWMIKYVGVEFWWGCIVWSIQYCQKILLKYYYIKIIFFEGYVVQFIFDDWIFEGKNVIERYLIRIYIN